MVLQPLLWFWVSSIELSKQIPDMEVYFIYADETGNNKVYMSENFEKLLVEEPFCINWSFCREQKLSF